MRGRQFAGWRCRDNVGGSGKPRPSCWIRSDGGNYLGAGGLPAPRRHAGFVPCPPAINRQQRQPHDNRSGYGHEAPLFPSDGIFELRAGEDFPHFSQRNLSCNRSNRLRRGLNQSRDFGYGLALACGFLKVYGLHQTCGRGLGLRDRSARPGRLGQPRQPLQERHLVFGEGVGLGRERLQYAHPALLPAQGHDGDGLQPHLAANLGIDVEIPAGIIAAQAHPGTQAFAGDTRVHVEPVAQFGRGFAASAHADHGTVPGHGKEAGISRVARRP